MAKKPKINILVEDQVDDQKEDIALSQLADSREHEKSELVKHEDAWKIPNLEKLLT